MSGGPIDMGAFELQPNLLTGDYNFDGTVDAADYACGKTHAIRQRICANGNGDGIVDEMDRLVWRSNFGRNVGEFEATEAGDFLAIDEISAATLGDAVADYVGSPGVAAGMADDSPVIVNTLLDVVDFNDGVTSLREAIFATNLASGPDTIEFAPALTADSPAKIVLTQGELKITDSLTIDWPGRRPAYGRGEHRRANFQRGRWTIAESGCIDLRTDADERQHVRGGRRRLLSRVPDARRHNGRQEYEHWSDPGHSWRRRTRDDFPLDCVEQYRRWHLDQHGCHECRSN